MLKYFKEVFSAEGRYTRRQREIENYLAKSTDLVDLERRQRELDRKGAYRWL